MDGIATNRSLWIAAAVAGAGAALAYWAYTQGYFGSSDGSSDGETGSGDASNDGASGSLAAAYSSIASGLSSAAASVGYSLGISTPKGIRNNNPGNLRYVASIPWTGQTGDDGTGYAVFDSAEHGVRALGRQLQTYAGRGLTSVREIISTYAPSNENDTAAYISAVAGELGVDPDQPLDVYGVLPNLVAAIIHHENGIQPYDLSDLQTWVYEP